MARPRNIDAGAENLGADRSFNINEIGSGSVEIEAVERNLTPDLVETEAFMYELVTIMIADTNDENDADMLVQVAVNGRNQFFVRGQPQDVRRCYVERLARAKKRSFSQNLDERLGENVFNTMKAHNTLRYPFTVISDPNPKGAAWLRAILSERT